MCNSSLIESYEYKGYTIEIHSDDCYESPREWDNLGALFIKERNFSIDELDEPELRIDNFGSWEELDKAIDKVFPRCLWLPIYKYEHSNVCYNTTGFSCPWDSGRVGYVLVTREDMLKEYGGKIVSAKKRKLAESVLKSEINTFSQYMNGECYGYKVMKEDEEIDSVWGYLGYDYVKQEAESIVDYHTKPEQEDK